MNKQAAFKNFINGAGILTGSSLIAKALSAAYRIPLQNLVGNVGFYIYQQVYPIYGIGMTFALTGLPVLISKLVAEEPDRAHQIGMLKRIHLILCGLAGLIFGGLQLGAPLIADQMGDLNLVIVIRAVSWMFWLMPLLATSRGFFQGTLNMIPTATSQVVEQLVRITIIIMVALIAHSHHWNLYRMGAWAMLSSPIAALCSAGVLIGFLWPWLKLAGHQPQLSNWQITKQLVVEGGTICLIASLMIMMQLIDSFTIRRGLLAAGVSLGASQEIKGVYDRAQPLVQVGLVMGTAFASTALPALTQALKENRQSAFQMTARLMLKISVVVTSLITVSLFTLMPAVNLILFGNPDGSFTLALYCTSMVLATLITTENSILQSVGHFRVGLLAVGVSMLIKWLLTEPLVIHFGILGGSLSTLVALGGGLIVNEIGVHHLLALQMNISSWFWKLVITAIGMSGGMWLVQIGLQTLMLPGVSRLVTFGIVIITTMVGMVIASGLVLKLQIFAPAELALMPIVSRWLKS